MNCGVRTERAATKKAPACQGVEWTCALLIATDNLMASLCSLRTRLLFLLVLLDEFRDLVMSAPGRPRERCCPRRIIGKVRRCAAFQKKLNHLKLAGFSRPPERRRTNVLVTRAQIGSVVEEERRFLDVARSRELVKRRDAQPVCVIRIRPALKKKFRQLFCLCVSGDSFREIGLMMKHQ